MSEYESITIKLSDYLLNNLGFKKVDGELFKELTDEEDIHILASTVIGIHEGKLFGGKMSYYYGTIEENYILDVIEERFEEFLPLTEAEKNYLKSWNDDIHGWDSISEWIWENIHVEANRKIADAYAKNVLKKKKEEENGNDHFRK